jgi:hypothetical protein
VCDLHGLWKRPQVVGIARAMEPFDPMGVEDPVIMDHMDMIGEAARATRAPIAVGETCGMAADYNHLLDLKALSLVIMPFVDALVVSAECTREGHPPIATREQALSHCAPCCAVRATDDRIDGLGRKVPGLEHGRTLLAKQVERLGAVNRVVKDDPSGPSSEQGPDNLQLLFPGVSAMRDGEELAGRSQYVRKPVQAPILRGLRRGEANAFPREVAPVGMIPSLVDLPTITQRGSRISQVFGAFPGRNRYSAPAGTLTKNGAAPAAW